jgi:hypothetical protein
LRGRGRSPAVTRLGARAWSPYGPGRWLWAAADSDMTAFSALKLQRLAAFVDSISSHRLPRTSPQTRAGQVRFWVAPTSTAHCPGYVHPRYTIVTRIYIDKFFKF